MSNFAVEIWNDEAEKVTFYTVRQEGDHNSETDLFLERYENERRYESAVQELIHFVVTVIGDKYGAIDELFNRPENEVWGLPAHGRVKLREVTLHYPSFPLRLYALRITDQLVILFGGGEKRGSSIQNSKGNLHLKWKEACRYATKINDALRDETLIVDQRNLLLFNGSSEIYL